MDFYGFSNSSIFLRSFLRRQVLGNKDCSTINWSSVSLIEYLCMLLKLIIKVSNFCVYFYITRKSLKFKPKSKFCKIIKFTILNVSLQNKFDIKQIQISMQEFLEEIRTHFNIIHENDYLSLTLINPNLDLDIIRSIKNKFRLQHHIKRQEIIIIESVTFDDQLLEELAEALPESLQELTLDFTGCESLRGTTFPHLFERLSSMNLRKLKLDLSQVFDVNDLVIQGLSLLLQSLCDLEQFYLDLYQVDQITEQGYLLLAQSLTSLEKLKNLHLDFSANPNMTQDNLQLFFTNISSLNLELFEFRILDIDHIGGGSFFKLGQTLSKMTHLQTLGLTISTFSNLNQKGIYAILKEITYLQKLRTLTLNISDIQLSQKVLSYMNLPSSVQSLTLDISCNSAVTDGDILNLIKNVKNLSKLSLNLDFCNKVTDDSLEELIDIYLKNKRCTQLTLPDRKYSSDLIKFIIKRATETQSIIKLQISQVSKQLSQQYQTLQTLLTKRQNKIFAGVTSPIQPIHQVQQQGQTQKPKTQQISVS